MTMNKFQKIALSSLLAAALPLSSAAAAAGPVLTSDSSSKLTVLKDTSLIKSSLLESVNRAVELGLMGGYSDGKFHPADIVSRQELAAILFRTLELMPTAAKSAYTDVKTASWSSSSINAITAAGIMSGDGTGKFWPKAPITRQESAAMLVRASGQEIIPETADFTAPADWSSVAEWAKPYVRTAIVKGYMPLEDGKFSPKAGVQRQEMAGLLIATFFSGTTMENLQSVSSGSATISGVKFALSGSSASLMNPANQDILNKAEVSFTSSGRTIQSLNTLYLNSSGKEPAVGQEEFSGNLVLDGQGATLDGNLEIRGDYLSIRNLTVRGDLIVTPKLLHDFKATNVKVLGKTEVFGGDSNTVIFENSTLSTVDVNKTGVHLETTGSTTAGQVTVSSDATISANAATPLSNIVVNGSASQVAINGSVANVTVTGNQSLSLTGNAVISNLNVQSSGTVALNSTGTVQNLQVSGGANVAINSTTVLSTSAAASSTITTGSSPVVNTAPKVVAPVADRILTLGTSEVIDIAGVFKDDEQSQLKLTAVSGSSTVVKAVLTGTQLTLTPLKAGSNITILMSADDQNGKKTNSSFKISVNTPPAATSAVADQLVVLGAAAREIDLSSWFSDADSDSLIYEAVSSDPVIATAQLSGHTLTVTGQTAGAAKVKLIAKDGRGGTAESEITVTVNKNPAAGNMEDQLLPVNGIPVEFPLDQLFSDDDLDPLTFTSLSSDPASVGAAVYGDKLILTPQVHGHATVTVSVEDGRGGSSQVTFAVNVNTIPQVSAIPDRSMKGADEPYTILLSDYFSDADSDNLTFSVQSSSPAVAEAEVAGDILKLLPAGHGITTISVVANDGYAGIVSASFELTVNDTPGTGTTPLGNQMLQENGDTLTVDLSTAFADPEGDDLTYTVNSSDNGLAAVSITGHTLSVTPKSHGTATVTVTAKDSYGATAQQSFTAVINAKPVAAAIAAQSLPHYGLPQELELSSYFNDPDGDVLVYSATSADTATAEAAVTGSKLTLTPKSPGTTKVTVQAHDGKGGITEYTFDVTVLRNQAPVFAGVSKQILQENGSTVDLELSAIFSDPEQDVIAYSVQSEDTSIVATLLTGTKLTLTPKASGLVKVQVKASDDKGNDTTQDIEALVNAAPLAAAGSLPDLDLQEDGSPLDIDLLPVFTDPEAGPLTYTAESGDPAKTAVSVTGSTLTISPKAYGSPVIQVTASDADGGKTKVSFTVHVNAAPKAVGDKLTDTTLYTGSPATEIDLSTAFTDADGDTLSFSASTDAGSTVNAAVTGKMLKLTPAAQGTAVITVTAQDQRGGQVTVSFTVTVSSKPNTAPEAVSAISPQILTPGVTNTRTYDLSQLFEDADNDTLTYTAVIDSAAAGAVSVSGNMLSLSPAAGSSASGIVTVTASDGKGGTAAYSFALTTAQLVSNGLVPINTKQGVQSLSYDISKLFPGQTSFKVYMGTADSTFTGPTPLNGTIWTGTPMPGYVWIVGADGRAIVLSITVSPQGSGELFFSEYLDGGDGRIAVELYYKNTGTPIASPQGYTIEVYRYMKNTQTITSTSQTINTQWPTMSPYLFINDIFYDAFDIMNIWYYNDELSLYNPSSYDVVAIVLKKNGQIVDMLGNPASNQKFLSSGGTIIRKPGIYTGSGQFSLEGEWNVFPKGTYQYFGTHSL
ncbi:Ig-like domain-containing protein [Paenibacillus pedocola]|uniref:Ig-like domain-containing protein n=1 Tax=Paenibacillus pedocola TaxID=3242193 RepID=UPI002877D5A3|nr:S-layer homology domain-containing protein [Paenibacillus typhae]